MKNGMKVFLVTRHSIIFTHSSAFCLLAMGRSCSTSSPCNFLFSQTKEFLMSQLENWNQSEGKSMTPRLPCELSCIRCSPPLLINWQRVYNVEEAWKKRIIHHKKKKSWITLNFANHHQPLDNSSTSDSHLRFSALDNIIAPHTFPHSTATHQLLLAFAHLKNTLKKNTAKVNEFDYLVVENPTSRTFACFAALRNMNMKEKKISKFIRFMCCLLVQLSHQNDDEKKNFKTSDDDMKQV